MTVDAIDRRILRALQTDSRQTVAEIGAVAGLSPSACHRRIRSLEQAGVIAGYTARLDRRALGYAMEFFVEVALRSQSEKALEAFEQLARLEGIIPALESAHAVAHASMMAGKLGRSAVVLVNLSGRGDKDVHSVEKMLSARVAS